MTMDSKTTLQLHIAAQYLAAAGKNYVAPEEDDSHTNIGWEANTASFFSRTFSNMDSLVFHTYSMNLEWSGKKSASFDLIGHSHAEVLQWLEDTSLQNGLEKFVFDLHYSLDSGNISNDFSFDGAHADSLETHADYRTFADRACNALLTELGMKAEVRTWPHHFDTGAFVMVSDSKVGIGFGLSMPSSLSEDYYLYTAGYVGHDGLSTTSLPALSKGDWVSGEWEGGILPATGLNESDYLTFFKESIGSIRSSILMKQSS